MSVIDLLVIIRFEHQMFKNENCRFRQVNS